MIVMIDGVSAKEEDGTSVYYNQMCLTKHGPIKSMIFSLSMPLRTFSKKKVRFNLFEGVVSQTLSLTFSELGQNF